MSDLSEFNNNNYMPGFYGDMNSIGQHNLASNFNLRGGNVLPQPFTFTSPSHGTNSNSLSSPRHNTQASQLSNLSAPGVGTTWQHSVPTTMPWSNTVVSNMSQQGVQSYDEQIHPFNGYHHHSMLDPQPSCSSPMKRPKRKALEYSEDVPMSKVYLCANQFASLQISPEKESEEDRQVRHISFTSNSGRNGKENFTGWERFREVENNIDYDSEEDSVKKESTTSSKKGVICFDEKLIQDAATSSSSSPLLPKQVLDDIAKPCLQLVLWKSPGELMRDVVKDDSKCLTPPPSLTSPPSNPSLSSSSPIDISSRDQTWSSSSSPSSTITSDNIIMMEDESLTLSNVPNSLSRHVGSAAPTNPCLLSHPPVSSLNWLSASSSSSSSSNHLNLASSSHGPTPFGLLGNPDMVVDCNSGLLDDEMLL